MRRRHIFLFCGALAGNPMGHHKIRLNYSVVSRWRQKVAVVGAVLPASGAALHWLIAPSVLLILTCYLLLALGCLGSHGREPIKTYIFLIYLFFSSLVAPQGGAVATSGASATSAGGALQWPSVRCCNNRWHTGTTTLSGDSPAVFIHFLVSAVVGFSWVSVILCIP